jgi:hypothetical protein
MSERDNTDVWTAVVIGAVVGIGTALIVRARQEDDVHDIVRQLRRIRPRAQQAATKVRRGLGRQAERATGAGEELVGAGRELLAELRREATGIVRSTRRELQQAARDTLQDARTTMKQARGGVRKRVRTLRG